MKFVLALLALATGASAFTPVGIRPNTFKSDKTVLDMPGIQAPIGFFDPAGFSETASPEAMLWFRAAELKVFLRKSAHNHIFCLFICEAKIDF